MKRKKRLKSRSVKTRRAYDGDSQKEGRRELVGRLLAERGFCEAGAIRAGFPRGTRPETGDEGAFAGINCSGEAHDVHEILPRSAGGSIDDESNLLVVCRADHEWIHQHPIEAKAFGLLASRYETP